MTISLTMFEGFGAAATGPTLPSNVVAAWDSLLDAQYDPFRPDASGFVRWSPSRPTFVAPEILAAIEQTMRNGWRRAIDRTWTPLGTLSKELRMEPMHITGFVAASLAALAVAAFAFGYIGPEGKKKRRATRRRRRH